MRLTILILAPGTRRLLAIQYNARQWDRCITDFCQVIVDHKQRESTFVGVVLWVFCRFVLFLFGVVVVLLLFFVVVVVFINFEIPFTF